MPYELSKELKDAGFPQTVKGAEREDRCYINLKGNLYNFENASFNVEAYIPTLEELIEACGDNILGLNRTHADDGTPNGWVADTHTHECDCGKSNCFGFNWEHEAGSTPTEAVARLWLALNKKVDNLN